MKTQWIQYQGKRILLCDYSNFGLDLSGVSAEADTAIELASAEPKSSVLTLTLITGTKGSPGMFNLLKQTAERIAPYARRRTVVGVTGIQRTFMDAINKVSGNKNFVLFDNPEQARDWLIKA